MADPLVAWDFYVTVTSDTDSDGNTVGMALARAQTRAEQWCRRPFGYGQYTETLYVYPDGCASPTVTPLAAVQAPSDVVPQGDRVFLGYLTPNPIVLAGGFTGAYPPQTEITYTGGWTASTLPEDLAEAICRIAFRMLHPVVLVGVPAGVTSAAVGDVHLQAPGPLDGFQVLDRSVLLILGRYRRRQVRGWQATPVLIGDGL